MDKPQVKAQAPEDEQRQADPAAAEPLWVGRILDLARDLDVSRAKRPKKVCR
jgi:hypothetical protein